MTRYVAWLQRRWRSIALGTLGLLLGSLYLVAFRLPLYADLSYLLPEDAPAVRGLRELERRVPSKDTTIVVIDSRDPAARASAAELVAARARQLPSDLVDRVDAVDPLALGLARRGGRARLDEGR